MTSPQPPYGPYGSNPTPPPPLSPPPSPAPYVIQPVPPQQPPRSPDGRRKLIALLVAASLVLVVIVTGGIWLLGSDDGGTDTAKGKDHGTGQGAKAPWSLPYTQSGRTFAESVRGVWFTDKAVVKALPDGVAGLDRRDGHRLWGVATPGSDTVICQASTDAGGNVAILAAGSGRECHHVFAVDIASGRLLWQKELADNRDNFSIGHTRIARAQDTVVVSAPRKSTTAFRVSDGTQLWTDAPAVYGGQQCVGDKYTGGRQLVRIQKCHNGTDTFAPYAVAAVDPVTGKALWTYQLGNALGRENSTVVTTDPVVVSVAGSDQRLRMTVLDAGGKVRAALASGDEERPRLSADDGSTPSPGALVKGGTLYMVATPTTPHSDGNNKIVAWSLSTGRRLWEQQSTGLVKAFTIVASDTPDVLAYSSGNVYDPSALVRFDPATGKQTVVHQYPADPQGPRIGPAPLALLNQDTLYLSSGTTAELADSDQDKRQKALIALPVK
ncbi:PQQ-binding-like beta-propeller repeat protein [Streptomyces sp. NPDC058301]|uniref:outer membrane protein assembly factor BamB family protein n=1 Tax=Streptomyces sp. NPDC058301 TaxID=3346436 RepID=UPI0036E48C5E